VVERLPRKRKALGSVPSSEKKNPPPQKKNYFWAGEMAQWLRALAALPEDLGFSSQHLDGAHNHQ